MHLDIVSRYQLITIAGNTMTNLSVRGVDESAVARLKDQAKSQGTSLNAYLVELIQRSAGVRTKAGRHPEYQDLDDLAGTWTPKDVHDFEESQRAFGRVDEELWRRYAFFSTQTLTPLLKATPSGLHWPWSATRYTASPL